MYDWRLYDVGGAVGIDILCFFHHPHFVRSGADIVVYFGSICLAWTSEYSGNFSYCQAYQWRFLFLLSAPDLDTVLRRW
jgi:hypothetical protein